MFVSVLCLLALFGCGFADKIKGETYAVLVAGSNEYWNYRHQSDVAHAYQVLRNHGIEEENIITFMYDDVADSDDNPFPGKLFNRPKGEDVYHGVKIDYRGSSVNPDNFVAVVKGQPEYVSGGNGRVLKSTKHDTVFIYFVDHGAVGLVSVINEILTAKDFNATLQALRDKEAYGELLFYLEACESGSMFESILPSDAKILAFTASGPSEPSWGVFCEDPLVNTCLGDLFSINWMEDAESGDLNRETIESQFNNVKKETTLSKVMKYGDLSVMPEIVGKFQGTQKVSKTRAMRESQQKPKSTSSWPSRDIPLLTVESKMKAATDPVKKAQLVKKLDEMKTKRAYHDMHTHSLFQKLTHGKTDAERKFILQNRPTRITDLDCHHEVVTAYHKNCFNLGTNPYAMTIAGPLNNLCELGIKTQQIVDTIKSHCVHKNIQMEGIH